MTTSNTNNSTLSAAEFRRRSYDAYIQYVALIEGKLSVSDAVKAIAPLASIYGLTLTPENLVNSLTVRMTSYGQDAGEKARKVKSISTFRTYLKAGWRDVSSSPVHSNAGKDPHADATKRKRTTRTKADLEAEIVALKAQLAAK